MSRKTALFGGTFDPPHLGHLILAESLASEAGLDRVIFIPTGRPPHKPAQQIIPSEHRCRMVSLAIADNPSFEISRWEVDQPTPNYTITTTAHFRRELPDDELYWLIGCDSLAELPTWRQFEQLISQIEILTAWRGGFDVDRALGQLAAKLSPPALNKLKANIIRTPMIELSSSDIRRRVSRSQDIRYLVPEPVRQYINAQGLYR